MNFRIIVSAITAGAFGIFAAPAANAIPVPIEPVAGPPRTVISVQSAIPAIRLGTPGELEMRSGLSIVKLYMADYALRHGDGSAADRVLAERMIRFSDDGAAGAIHAKYPDAITATASEF